MTGSGMHDFGVVAEQDDSYEFHIDTAAGGVCRLVSVVQTERGPRRTDLADIPAALWRKMSVRVVRELTEGMGESERSKAAPKLRTGTNRLSPLIGRELALLLWALQEEGATEQLEAILHGWRELAREERWWLYAKAAAPGQRAGIGWRRALFHALSEAAESRAAAPSAEKKPGSIGLPPPFTPTPSEDADAEQPIADNAPASPRRKKKKRPGNSGEPQLDLF